MAYNLDHMNELPLINDATQAESYDTLPAAYDEFDALWESLDSSSGDSVPPSLTSETTASSSSWDLWLSYGSASAPSDDYPPLSDVGLSFSSGLSVLETIPEDGLQAWLDQNNVSETEKLLGALPPVEAQEALLSGRFHVAAPSAEPRTVLHPSRLTATPPPAETFRPRATSPLPAAHTREVGPLSGTRTPSVAGPVRTTGRDSRRAAQGPYPKASTPSKPSTSSQTRRAPRAGAVSKANNWVEGRRTSVAFDAAFDFADVSEEMRNCPDCGKGPFNRGQDMLRHRKTHRPKQDKCVGITVADALELGMTWGPKHEREYDGEVYVGGCGKEYSRPDAVHRHFNKSMSCRCICYNAKRAGEFIRGSQFILDLTARVKMTKK